MIIDSILSHKLGVSYNEKHSEYEKELTKHCLNLSSKIKKSGGENWLAKIKNSSGVIDLKTDKKFKPLLNWMHESAKLYAKNLGMLYKNKPYVPKIDGAWFNVYEKHNYQEYHKHSSILSSIYYLKGSLEDARTFFKSNTYESFPIEYKVTSDETGVVYHNCEPGKCLIFRGHLDHAVEQKITDDLRITIAVNYV